MLKGSRFSTTAALRLAPHFPEFINVLLEMGWEKKKTQIVKFMGLLCVPSRTDILENTDAGDKA